MDSFPYVLFFRMKIFSAIISHEQAVTNLYEFKPSFSFTRRPSGYIYSYFKLNPKGMIHFFFKHISYKTNQCILQCHLN